MYRISEENSALRSDVAKFIDLINSDELLDFFAPDLDIFIARAPGRLDVMGGIADYSGSLVLEMPIAEATLAAVQKIDEKEIRIVSKSVDAETALTFQMELLEIDINDGVRYYDRARERFSSDPTEHWAAYVVGAFFALKHELGINFQNGARILISSRIPIGKGVSSSAALEVASMQAICAAFEIDLKPLELALLCQKVENLIVGAPCGVMDQITSHCGLENSLISLLCQPARILGMIEIPDEIELWGIDSGLRHAITGSDYASVRIGAFMGYRIIADLAGLKVSRLDNGVVKIKDDRWNGYLCNISSNEYEREFSSRMPETINGKDFINKYGGTTDNVTTIDLSKTYATKAPTEHAIYENARANEFSKLLESLLAETVLDRLGELMFQSHSSYNACGLTEDGTNRLVSLVRENKRKGLFGARITGGGSGGTVAILAQRGSAAIIANIANQYESETGRKPYIFHGSSPGCAVCGYLRLRPA